MSTGSFVLGPSSAGSRHSTLVLPLLDPRPGLQRFRGVAVRPTDGNQLLQGGTPRPGTARVRGKRTSVGYADHDPALVSKRRLSEILEASGVAPVPFFWPFPPFASSSAREDALTGPERAYIVRADNNTWQACQVPLTSVARTAASGVRHLTVGTRPSRPGRPSAPARASARFRWFGPTEPRDCSSPVQVAGGTRLAFATCGSSASAGDERNRPLAVVRLPASIPRPCGPRPGPDPQCWWRGATTPVRSCSIPGS